MTDTVFEYLTIRLRGALKRQEEAEGKICATPTVEYCFECDEITVDARSPERCIDHPTVLSDGHEHDGIGSALTAIRFLQDLEEDDD